jgi:hypothetical protein
MTPEEQDALLAAELRDVPIPDGLAARLRTLGAWPDEEIDRELAAVSPPHSLAARLHAIPFDDELDRGLRNVALPVQLVQRMRRAASGAEHWQQAIGALAAMLLLTVSLGYGAFAANMLLRARVATTPSATWTVGYAAEMRFEPERVELASPEVIAWTSPDAPSDAAALTPLDPWPTEASAGSSAVSDVLALWRTGELTRSVYGEVLGAVPVTTAETPPLTIVRMPTARGIAAPLVRGYDRAFLLRTGVHPPIVPSLQPSLQRSLAPLSFSTTSFDDALAALAAKRALSADDIRVEDFIAAGTPRWPHSGDHPVALHIAGAASPFGPEGSRVLAIGVSAGVSAAPRTHLVAVIDFSADLATIAAWPMLREALVDLVARQRSQDRTSLLFLQDEVVMASQPLQAGDAPLLRQRLLAVEPDGTLDLSAGIAAGLDLALAADTPAENTQLVVVTPGRFDLTTAQSARLASVANDAKKSGVPMHLVQLGGEVASGGAELAKVMHASAHAASERRQLVERFVGYLTNHDVRVASETRVIVEFNPAVVAAYRMVGHEANSMARLVAPGTTTELISGDRATVLFELLATAAPPQASIAQVRCEWVDPHSGEKRSAEQTVSQSEIMGGWDSAPAELRSATIAAEAAEKLRRSRQQLRQLQWARRDPVTWAELLAQVRQVEPSSEARGLMPLGEALRRFAELPEESRR